MSLLIFNQSHPNPLLVLVLARTPIYIAIPINRDHNYFSRDAVLFWVLKRKPNFQAVSLDTRAPLCRSITNCVFCLFREQNITPSYRHVFSRNLTFNWYGMTKIPTKLLPWCATLLTKRPSGAALTGTKKGENTRPRRSRSRNTNKHRYKMY